MCAIGALMTIGATLAYFTTTSNLKSFFKTGLYQNQIIETFESPANWTPGTVTPLSIDTTNTGNVSMAIRASYVEKWVSSNKDVLELEDENNNTAAIINFSSDWTLNDDGYYYYGSKENKTELLPGQTSSSFIQSVKFNENIKATLNEVISDDGKTITYTSDSSGYDNATYSLIITIDTIQYDQADNIW